MIAIYFRPDVTQVLQSSLGKDMKLHIEGYEEMEPALPYLLDEGAAAKASLTRFLQELKKDSDAGSDDVYAILPDYVFSYVESVEYINDENLAVTIKEQTGEEMENLYITKPVITESPAPDRQSVYAIQKRYIDRLISASMQERIAIISVEPASMAFFRIYGKWAEEMPLVEMFPEHASIITYSPAGGIFLSDAPTLQEKELLADGAKSNGSISTAYAANDFAAGQTYLNVNTDMHYVVLTDNKNILNIPSLRFRLPPEPVSFPEYIDSGSFPKEMELIWMPLAGTLLQAFDDLPEKMQVDNPLYESLPPFVHIESANLLPDLARQAARNRQWKRVIGRVSKMLSGTFAAAICVEIAFILYFSTFAVPQGLQADYNKAKMDLESINHEVEVIGQAKKENQHTFQAFHGLAEARPDGCGFADLKIGSDNPENAKKSLEYIQLTAVAGNELIFQQFRENLAEDSFFTSPSINSISADTTSGFKVARMTIAKGEDKE